MSAPFIDATGFHALGLPGWLAQLTADYQSIYGATVDLSPDSPDGQCLGILAAKFNDLEQLLEQVYLGRSPAGAVGAGLSRLVQLNGIQRKAAQYSTAPITLTGTPGTPVPAGSTIGSKSDQTLPDFMTLADYTIGGGGTVTGQAICTIAGPVNVGTDDLQKIKTVVPGWTNVTNTAPTAPGLLLEQDAALRARRAVSVAIPSQSMLDVLYGALLNLPGVVDAAVYENPTAKPDPSGKSIPPRSIHVIVEGGVDADIANTIWTKSSMGSTKVGSVTFTVTDTQSNPQLMQWDTPLTFAVYITVKLDTTPSAFLVDAIQKALFAYGNQLDVSKIGRNVVWLDLATPINALGLTGEPGLPSVTNIYLGHTASPVTQADLAVPYNGRPYFGASPTAQISVVGP